MEDPSGKERSVHEKIEALPEERDADSVPPKIRTPAWSQGRSCLRGPSGWFEKPQVGVGRPEHLPHARYPTRWAAVNPERRAESRACAERGGGPPAGPPGSCERGGAHARPRPRAAALSLVVSLSRGRRSSRRGRPSRAAGAAAGRERSGAAAAAVRGRPVFRGPARWLPARRAQPAWEEGGGSRPAGRRSREETMSGRRPPPFSTTERVIKGAERAAGNGPRRATARGLEERGWRQRREALQGAGRTGQPSAGVLSDCWTGT